jgi:hypothetical protein
VTKENKCIIGETGVYECRGPQSDCIYYKENRVHKYCFWCYVSMQTNSYIDCNNKEAQNTAKIAIE